MKTNPYTPQLKHFIKNRSLLSHAESVRIFDQFVVAGMDAESSFRDLFTLTVFLWNEQRIDQDNLNSLRVKLNKVLTNERKRRAPELALQQPIEPNADAPQTIVIVEANQTITLGEMAIKFAPGQEQRFVDDNFTPQTLEFHYDQIANPDHYADGFLRKALLKGIVGMSNTLAKNPSAFAESVFNTMKILWTDDGKSHNSRYDDFQKKHAKKIAVAM